MTARGGFGGLKIGVVAAFDAHEGFGTVRDPDGAEYFFHCTQIAGGSRRIDEGTRVAYLLDAGHRGRWEATRVTPV